MGFTIVHGSPMLIWCPIVDSDTIYVGQIVANQANEGVVPISTASGNADTSGKLVPWGVVTGTSNKNPVYDTSLLTDKIVDATPLASTTEFAMVEGVWAKGDKQAMVQVALITPETILRGPIFTDSIGTAPTLLTVTTGDASGVTCTTNATDEAGVAAQATLYFRSGANTGTYRITDDTSTTALEWDKPTTYAVAIDDTAVRINLRQQGPTQANFDSESLYIDSGATVTSNYYVLDILKLDLSVAGSEHAYFKFNIDHFGLKRA